MIYLEIVVINLKNKSALNRQQLNYERAKFD